MSFLLPKVPDTRTEGPRLESLSAPASNYGAFLNNAQGTVRINGQVIWSSDIREEVIESSQDVGGKGGGGGTATTVSYKYFVDFAVAFSRGRAKQLIKLWGDSKILFNAQNSGPGRQREGVSFRFYDGLETQLPDDLIKETNADAPAYRETVYIVFENFPLADFGNRIPAITALINYESLGGTPYTINNFTQQTQGAGSFRSGVNHQLGKIYVPRSSGQSSGINQFNINTGLFEATYPVVGNEVLNSDHRLRVNSVDQFTGNVSVSTFESLIINISSFARLSHVLPAGASGPGGLATSTFRLNQERFFPGHQFENEPAPGKYGGILFSLFALGQVWTAYLSRGNLDNSTLAIRGNDMRTNMKPIGLWTGAGQIMTTFVDPFPGSGKVFGAQWADNGTTITLYEYNIIPQAPPEISSITRTARGTISASQIGVSSFTNAPFINFNVDLMYDEVVPGFVMVVPTNAGFRAIKVDDQGNLAWNLPVPIFPQSDLTSGVVLYDDGTQGDNNDKLSDGKYIYSHNNRLVAIDTISGQFLSGLDGSAQISNLPGDRQFYSGPNGCMISLSTSPTAQLTHVCLGNATERDTTLGNIVRQTSLERGLTDSDIDVTALTDIVPGWIVNSPTRGDQALKPLSEIFQFDPVEVDGKIKFVKRGGASVESITEDQMVAKGENSPYTEVKKQARELPNEVNIGFIQKGNKYEPGSASAREINNPELIFASDNVETFEAPIVHRQQRMENQADKILTERKLGAREASFDLPWRHLARTPTDVMTITYDSGFQYEARITQFNINPDLTLAVRVKSQASSSFADLDQNADAGLDQADVLPIVAPMLGNIFDMPLARDADFQLGAPAYYFTGYPQTVDPTATYRGGTLMQSPSSGLWVPVAALDNGTPTFTVTSVLPTLNEADYWTIDDTTTITVQMLFGTLSSVTEEQFLNDQSLIAVRKANNEVEIIAFKNATLTATGTYTLQRIARGRRGTEVFGTGHAANEIGVFLNTDRVDIFQTTQAQVGSTLNYRPVSLGQLVEDAALRQISFQGTGRSIKPYAPVNLAVTENTGKDFVFTWTRRNRLYADWVESSDTVPLTDSPESYDYEILRGTTVIKTGNVTTPTVTLTRAERIAAQVTAPQDLILRVWQRGPAIGRGFQAERTFTNVGSVIDPGAKQYWRIVVNSVYDQSGVTTNTTIAEMEMRNLAFQADLTGSGTPLASAGTAANAFDNNTANVWTAAVGSNVGYNFGSAQVVGAIAITRVTGAANYNQAPQNFTVEYSTDGTNWFKAADVQIPDQYWNQTTNDTFVWAAPWRSLTMLLIHMDGSNGQTTFTDSSVYNRTLTRVGNTDVRNTAPLKFGGFAEFDGGNDGINVAYSDDILLKNRQFGMDCWIYQYSTSGFRAMATHYDNSPAFRSFTWDIHNGNRMRFAFTEDGSTFSNFPDTGATLTLPNNTWHHVAVDRDANDDFRLYLNGTMVDKRSAGGRTLIIPPSSVDFRLGVTDSLANDFSGRIDEFRLVVGQPIYGSDAGYTVPTAPYPNP